MKIGDLIPASAASSVEFALFIVSKLVGRFLSEHDSINWAGEDSYAQEARLHRWVLPQFGRRDFGVSNLTIIFTIAVVPGEGFDCVVEEHGPQAGGREESGGGETCIGGAGHLSFRTQFEHEIFPQFNDRAVAFIEPIAQESDDPDEHNQRLLDGRFSSSGTFRSRLGFFLLEYALGTLNGIFKCRIGFKTPSVSAAGGDCSESMSTPWIFLR